MPRKPKSPSHDPLNPLWDHVEHIAPPVKPGSRGYYVDGGHHYLTPCRVLSCRQETFVDGIFDPDPLVWWWVRVRLDDGSEIDTNRLSVYVLKGSGHA